VYPEKTTERLTGGSSTGKSWLDSDRDYSYDEVKTKSCPYYTILHISQKKSYHEVAP
jgi:hypothetical protein